MRTVLTKSSSMFYLSVFFMVILAGSSFSKMNNMLIKNMGQWPEEVLFRTTTPEAVVWIANDGVYYQFYRATEGYDPIYANLEGFPEDDLEKHRIYETVMIKAEFMNVSDIETVNTENQSAVRFNFLKSNESSNWKSNVSAYQSVTLVNIYDGVDVNFSKDNLGRLNYKFTAETEEALAQVQIDYKGDVSVDFDSENIPVVTSPWNQKLYLIHDKNLKSSEQIDLFQRRDNVRSMYSSKETNSSSSASPTLNFSTLIGGTSNEVPYGIAIDDSQNVYVCGSSLSTDFPTVNPYQTDTALNDIIVFKLSSVGDSLIYSTYIGGDNHDFSLDIEVDSVGNAYVVGYSSSNDFPTVNAYQTTMSQIEVVLFKLSPAGDSFVYSTYFGGNNSEVGRVIKIDDLGQATISGYVNGNIPYKTGINTYRGGYDLFLTKFGADGDTLIYSGANGSFLEDDWGYDMDIDDSGYIYLVGQTTSDVFPVVNGFQNSIGGGTDYWVMKIDPDGATEVFSSYLGGIDNETNPSIAADSAGNIYITGRTQSSNYPTLNSLYSYNSPNDDAVVTKISTATQSIVYSTFLGGTAGDYGMDIAVDNNGSAIVYGYGYSSNFPVVNEYQGYVGTLTLGDSWLTKFAPDGSSLEFSTYFGGTGDDWGRTMALDKMQNIYLAGQTASADFPTLNAYATDTSGSYDYFISKFDALVATDVKELDTPLLPENFSLSQNYPNPFNPTTTIEFSIPKASHVRLDVFNLNGQLVKKLVDEPLRAGVKSVEWDGTNNDGKSVASGIYLYRLVSDETDVSRKMLLLK